MSNPLPELDFATSQQLFRAVIGGFDDVQNMIHLMHGVELQLAGASDNMDPADQYAIEETVNAAKEIGLRLKAAIEAANALDIEAMIAREASIVVENLTLLIAGYREVCVG